MQSETAAEFIARKEREYRTNPRVKRMKDIGGQGSHVWVLEAATLIQQTGHPGKVLVFERLRRDVIEGKSAYNHKVGEVEYRIGYYVVSVKSGSRMGQWIWGQYCAMMPARDFDRLVAKAAKQGTLLKSV